MRIITSPATGNHMCLSAWPSSFPTSRASLTSLAVAHPISPTACAPSVCENRPYRFPPKNQKREAPPTAGAQPSTLHSGVQPGDLRPACANFPTRASRASLTSLWEAHPICTTACAPSVCKNRPYRFPPKNQKREAPPSLSTSLRGGPIRRVVVWLRRRRGGAGESRFRGPDRSSLGNRR